MKKVWNILSTAIPIAIILFCFLGFLLRPKQKCIVHRFRLKNLGDIGLPAWRNRKESEMVDPFILPLNQKAKGICKVQPWLALGDSLSAEFFVGNTFRIHSVNGSICPKTDRPYDPDHSGQKEECRARNDQPGDA